MATVPTKGKDAGKGKRSLLDRFSLLVLNKKIVNDHVTGWTENDIRARSTELAKTITRIWPRPTVLPSG